MLTKKMVQQDETLVRWPRHEQPVKTQYITVEINSSLCFSGAHIINKGAPHVIEARARGARLEMRNGNLCTGK